VARPVDFVRRTALLDEVVVYLSKHGLADVSMRPMANELDVSVNSLVHHFGSKNDLIIAALRRSGIVQEHVEQRWLARRPDMSQADLLRAWWRWIIATPQNLAIVRLGIDAVATEATIDGPPRQARGEQIRMWRTNIESRLVTEGVPYEIAVTEASLTKAMFTGLVVDLLATGQKARLTKALEVGASRLEQVVRSNAGLGNPKHPDAPRLNRG